MTEIINENTLAEYEAFVQGHPKGNFAQSSYWAKQKSAWTWRAIACRDADGKIKGTLSVLIRKMPGFRRAMMYASRGPVCDIDDYATMDELFARAKELAKEFKAYVFKIDPDIPSSETAFTDYMTKYGFEIKAGGAKFEAIQPRYVFRLYLEGRSEEELMASFHQKTRYNIRLAMRPPETGLTAEAYRARQGCTVNHFYEKLFLLKDMMNTDTAKALAADRDRFMRAFLERFLAEWEGP